ncbi:MAG: hypothetical protein P8Z80_08145 [Pseudolabrys sp.]
MRKQGSVNFMIDRSVRFEDSARLVRFGLMRTEEALEQSVRMTRAARAQQSAAGLA